MNLRYLLLLVVWPGIAAAQTNWSLKAGVSGVAAFVYPEICLERMAQKSCWSAWVGYGDQFKMRGRTDVGTGTNYDYASYRGMEGGIDFKRFFRPKAHNSMGNGFFIGLGISYGSVTTAGYSIYQDHAPVPALWYTFAPETIHSCSINLLFGYQQIFCKRMLLESYLSVNAVFPLSSVDTVPMGEYYTGNHILLHLRIGLKCYQKRQKKF